MDNIKHLTLKHKELDSEITEIQHVKPEFLTIEQETRLHDLKKQKLKIKDELNRLRKHASGRNNHIADATRI